MERYRPALGLRPWFALLRRALILRFVVFLDIRAGYPVGCDAAQAMRSSAAIVLTISAGSMPSRAALSQP